MARDRSAGIKLGATADVHVEAALGAGGCRLPLSPAAAQLLDEVRHALQCGGRLSKLDEMTSNGVYLIRDSLGQPVAVFKPQDEEGSGVSDLSESIQRGCRIGEGARREYLAYMLDSQAPDPFRAGVPPTALAKISHPLYGMQTKIGSLQQFVASRGPSEDFGASSFSQGNVQRLALFDLRTLNLDRHGSNMLVDAYSGNLVPIDHGYAFPSKVGEPWLDWRLWPQARAPLDKETSQFVSDLNPLAAKPLVKLLGLGDGVWQTVAIMTVLLQSSISAGKSLREIAEMTMLSLGRQQDAGLSSGKPLPCSTVQSQVTVATPS